MSVHSDFDIFCENIRYLRRVHGLSLEDMARLLEIGLPALRQLEAGVIPPDMEITVLDAIERAFSVPLSHMFRQLS